MNASNSAKSGRAIYYCLDNPNHIIQSVLKRHQLAVFRRAPAIFQLAKNALMDTLVEYLLLGIWPISLFLHLCNILEANLRK